MRRRGDHIAPGALVLVALLLTAGTARGQAFDGRPGVGTPDDPWTDVPAAEVHLPLGVEASPFRQVVRLPGDGPSLLTDAAIWTTATMAFSFAKPHIRNHMFREGWAENIWENLRDPVGRAIESNDNDPFYTNYISHPLTWGGLGFYLKERGYGDWEALAFSQAHSVLWEYVIEGSWAKPSGRDLVTNFTSSAVAIFGIHRLVEDVLRDGDDDRGGGESLPTLTLEPVVAPGAGGFGLSVRVSASGPDQ